MARRDGALEKYNIFHSLFIACLKVNEKSLNLSLHSSCFNFSTGNSFISLVMYDN